MNKRIEDEVYLRQIQETALGYLKNHQKHFPGNDQLLFCRAVRHLGSLFELSEASAQNIVGQAYGELKVIHERRRLDLAASTEKVAIVTDPDSGLTWAIPIAVIAERIIDSAHNRRLRLVG